MFQHLPTHRQLVLLYPNRPAIRNDAWVSLLSRVRASRQARVERY
jgi:hypothetical protein